MAGTVFGRGGPGVGFMGFDSGVTNGVRDDGLPIGAGCGTAATDHVAPDVVFGHDLTISCVNHDIGYGTCGVTKAEADTKLGNDVSAAMGGGLLGAAVGFAYEFGVSVFGQSAYDSAQAASGCNVSDGGYSQGLGSAYGGERQGL